MLWNHKVLSPIVVIVSLVISVSAFSENVVCVSRESGWDEAVFFPFDNVSIPWRYGLQLALVRANREDALALSLGGPGSPDSGRISYYGTVIRVNDEFRMWYLGHPAENQDRIRICYATSKDGRNWEKPNLGLVEFNGSKNNNLVKLDVEGDIMSCNVLYEPDDPNPDRRYKLFYEMRPEYRGHVAFSPDGLNWFPSPRNPVTHTRIEPTGLTKYEGCYYVCGQNANIDRGFQKRVLITLASYDFEQWTEPMCLGFRRDAVPPRPFLSYYNAGKQVHLGASLWNRGNVILGLYGMWNMPDDEMDRRRLRMDIGLLVSHDALHYVEPVPDFKLIDAFEEGWGATNPEGDFPALSQGQGFENVGDETLFWYGVWGPQNRGIRLAWWQRDRLGYFYPAKEPTEGQRWSPEVTPHFITCPIRTGNANASVALNVSGLNPNAFVTVELLDERFNPIENYAGVRQAVVKESGLNVPVSWYNGTNQVEYKEAFRIKVNYTGVRPEDIRVYAVYVKPAH